MNLNKLKSELIEQKKSKFKGNIYHFSQVNFAYNSNKIEGGRLTEDETEEITLEEKEAEVKEPEEEVTESKKEEFDPTEYRIDIDFESLSRKPDDYVGKKINVSGTVIETFDYDSGKGLRITVEDDQIMRVFYPSDLLDIRILDQDKVTVYGKYGGIDTYDTVLGNYLDVPYIDADHIDVYSTTELPMN